MIPWFGSTKLADITTADIDAYVAAKRRGKEPLGARTLGGHLTRLHSIFDAARRQGLVQANPVSDAERPRVPRSRWTILSPVQIAAVMLALDELVEVSETDIERAWRQTAKAMTVTMLRASQASRAEKASDPNGSAFQETCTRPASDRTMADPIVGRAGSPFTGRQGRRLMGGSFLRGAVVGLVCALLGSAATVALAGSGVGGVFNLGQSNSVNAQSTLTGASPAAQLQVSNTNAAAGASGLGVNSASSTATGFFNNIGGGTGLFAQTGGAAKTAVYAKNTGGGPAAAFVVNPGVSPFTVNSTGKVPSLNADQLDGLDSTSFLPKAGKAADAEMLDGLDSNNFTQGFASRVTYVKRTLVWAPSTTTQATLFDLGWIKLNAYCGGSVLIVAVSHPGTVDVGRTQAYYPDENDRAVTSFDALGGADIFQAGEKYNPAGGGFPRTRMATFIFSGSANTGQGCPVQAQVLAQGF